MVFHEGFYFYCEAREKNRCVVVRKSATIADIGADSGVVVWRAPRSGRNSNAWWAPELHFINGKWFIYYAADDGHNCNHRMWVLESETSDPQSPFHCRGQLQTHRWAIDGTILTADNGQLFFVWSGWPGKRNGRQNLYIAPMSDPVTISGPRVLIAKATEDWERVGMPICEGPQILQRDGRTFIVYSASGSWTPDYCLGMLVSKTGDFLNPNDWEKRGPVFSKTEYVWGVGHCSFVKSPCQSEDWILYHSKSSKVHGWTDRDVHAKKFTWTAEGLPDFGTPAPRTSEVIKPLTVTETAALLHITPTTPTILATQPTTATTNA
jgi:GH43 family beta-xylosidase